MHRSYHHLKDPLAGFQSVLRNTKHGGRFHCWVYAREGNALIVYLVDPLRKLVSRFPWWVTKYLVATPTVFPFYLYAKALGRLNHCVPRSIKKILGNLPLFEYAIWISDRDFSFFRHVAFDQLVTPQTVYIRKEKIQDWLSNAPGIDIASTYIIFRNGNSWKFGGLKKANNLCLTNS